jgi:hypothetical protein
VTPERVEEEVCGGERRRADAEADAERQPVAVELRGLTDGDFSSAPAGKRPAPGPWGRAGRRRDGKVARRRDPKATVIVDFFDM